MTTENRTEFPPYIFSYLSLLFDKNSSVQSIIDLYSSKRQVLQVRISEFNNTLQALTQEVETVEPDTTNIANLKDAIRGMREEDPSFHLKTLQEMFPAAHADHAPVIISFKNVNGAWKDTWDWLDEIENPGQKFSRGLLEGYGFHMAREKHYPDLQHLFTRAFGDMLLLSTPDNQLYRSALIQDLRPWIMENQDEFSYKARERLFSLPA